MSAKRRLDRGSLSRRVLFMSAAHTGLLLIALVALFYQTAAMRSRLERATTAYVEEQAIADRIANAVARQLVAALAYPERDNPEATIGFRAAGDEAYREIRRYLFRDLSPDQRLQLERVKEQQQLLEVTAVRALDVAVRGGQPAAAFADAVARQGIALQAAVDSFLRMREADLTQLRGEQAAAFRALQFGAAALAALLLLSSLMTARFFYRRLAAPLEELAGAAARIGDGDFDARVPFMRDDEFQALGTSFNQMADGLAGARSDIERRNRQLRDMLERLRDTQNELVQTEKLSAVGRMMAGMAHELNNPLASLLGYGQLLEAELDDEPHPALPELREDLVTPLVAEAERARRLVQTLLRFARKSDGELGAVPLADPLSLVQTLRGYAFEQAGLTLTIDETDARVIAEPQRLQQLLLNLVNNAFDAMRGAGHGTLGISVHPDGPRTSLIFEDDGPGFADPARAFEPFYTTKPVGQGTGLGLALVHRFMEEFGGTAAAENRPGAGARVVLTFRTAPRGRQPLADSAAPPATALAPAPLPPPPPPPPPGPAETQVPCILVVEDEAPLRNLQRRMLARIGVNVLVAPTAEAARAILRDQDVDLVISDFRMPGETGLDLYHWITEKRPTLVDRFIFVTGDIDHPDIVSLAEDRPDRFIRKPFQMAEYLERVKALVPC